MKRKLLTMILFRNPDNNSQSFQEMCTMTQNAVAHLPEEFVISLEWDTFASMTPAKVKNRIQLPQRSSKN